MGLLGKMKSFTGSVDKGLLEHGRLGRGIITGAEKKASIEGSGGFKYVCEFAVEVTLDDTPRYMATCRQAVDISLLPQLMSGVPVAVRVDPGDPQRIAISLGEEPPVVTMSSADPNVGSAADILENGEACRVVIVGTQPTGTRSSKSGYDMYAFVLSVFAEGIAPYQVTVGNPVPPAAVPLLFPGNSLPAKRMPNADERMLAIDWDAALSQAASMGAPGAA
jgi:hypothetical protein